MIITETERFKLRTWELDDLEAAKKLWGDPDVTKLIGHPEGLAEHEVLRKLEFKKSDWLSRNRAIPTPAPEEISFT